MKKGFWEKRSSELQADGALSIVGGDANGPKA